MKIKHIETINSDYDQETTNYWFNVDGGIFALSDNNGDLRLLDDHGIHCLRELDYILDAILLEYPEYYDQFSV